MIAIMDYGLGNISAFSNIYKNLGIPFNVAKTVEQLTSADRIILPGVGSFDNAMKLLKSSGLYGALNRVVLEEGVPILGVCVGMQMLAASSDEGSELGLGWIDGVVKKIDSAAVAGGLILPHMGWNEVRSLSDNRLLEGLNLESEFYFLHSFYFHCNQATDVIADVEYGQRFTCAVNHKNIFGVQFHPEKSHRNGVRLLKNFAEL
ncbi:MAG: imidazole glycerol phosphate synthase subunit HisH [Burkholderiaceae bacterium]